MRAPSVAPSRQARSRAAPAAAARARALTGAGAGTDSPQPPHGELEVELRRDVVVVETNGGLEEVPAELLGRLPGRRPAAPGCQHAEEDVRVCSVPAVVGDGDIGEKRLRP